jgi:hypothetical protein
VTVMCVYVCIPAHKTDKYRVKCVGERAGERETEINYEPPCDFKFRYNTSG